MKFYTQYDRPDETVCPLEHIPDEGLVESEGYLTTEELVNQMIQAGENLAVFRGEEYGPDEDIPEDAPALKMMDQLDSELMARNLGKKMKSDVDQYVANEKKRQEEVDKKAAEKVKEREEKSGETDVNT